MRKRATHRAKHLRLVVNNPPKETHKETPMPVPIFFALPFIFATAWYDGMMDAILGPLPEKLS